MNSVKKLSPFPFPPASALLARPLNKPAQIAALTDEFRPAQIRLKNSSVIRKLTLPVPVMSFVVTIKNCTMLGHTQYKTKVVIPPA